jgi:hypothetical protein
MLIPGVHAIGSTANKPKPLLVPESCREGCREWSNGTRTVGPRIHGVWSLQRVLHEAGVVELRGTA